MTTTQKWLTVSAVLIVIALLWYYFIYNPPASETVTGSDGPKLPPVILPGTVNDPGVVINTNKPITQPITINKPMVGA